MLYVLQLESLDRRVFGRIVVSNTTFNQEKRLKKGEILHFVQQFRIWADLMSEMLYSVQDFMKR
ncbi:hypothetical protein PBOR_03490 [Paenibacillus borealis]|uniref:Uncharacterized protein n=1 Tax=Paenibacillus borealis TaxID=160799 RepID=A0A089MHQ2_PAEBO|nr:hypothetical protein PBOR_03490 [Paenibacillus borealis]